MYFILLFRLFHGPEVPQNCHEILISPKTPPHVHVHTHIQGRDYKLERMATTEDKANDLKNQGNKAFAAHDWPTAIDFYSKAIELNDKDPAYWSNRAQVRPAVDLRRTPVGRVA